MKGAKNPRQWRMYAHRMTSSDKGTYYLNFGDKRWVELFHFEEPIVPVLLTEDENGHYYGWMETGEDKPCMIWPSRIQRDTCFAYGMQAAIDHGKGQPIKLKVEEIKEEKA